MKRVLLFIMLALGTSGLWQAMAQTQTKSKPFVHCIVLDKTKSMIGKDGTKQGTTINRQTGEVEWTAIKRTHDGQYQAIADEGENGFTAENGKTFLQSVYSASFTPAGG